MRDYREKLVHGWLSDGNIVGGIPVRVRMTSDDKGQSLSLSTEIGDEADLQIGIPLEAVRDIIRVADKKNKECPYFDYEVGTCRRSETMAITREDVKNLYEDMMNVVKTEDEKAEMEIIYTLYKGMTDSMQKAIKDIMIVTQEKKDNDN